MFEKDMIIEYLLDFYGDVLPERVFSVMSAYYGEDLSLAEIAEDEGISRQGVRHLIKKGEEQLHFLEDKLGLAAKYTSLTTLADTLEQMVSICDTSDTTVEKLIHTVEETIKQIRNQ